MAGSTTFGLSHTDWTYWNNFVLLSIDRPCSSLSLDLYHSIISLASGFLTCNSVSPTRSVSRSCCDNTLWILLSSPFNNQPHKSPDRMTNCSTFTLFGAGWGRAGARGWARSASAPLTLGSNFTRGWVDNIPDGSCGSGTVPRCGTETGLLRLGRPEGILATFICIAR